MWISSGVAPRPPPRRMNGIAPVRRPVAPACHRRLRAPITSLTRATRTGASPSPINRSTTPSSPSAAAARSTPPRPRISIRRTARRLSRLRQRAHRQRPAGPRPAQAADRHSHHRRHRQRDHRRRDLRLVGATPRRASPTATCGRRSGIVDPDNTRTQPPPSPPRPASTCSATPSNPTRRFPSTAGPPRAPVRPARLSRDQPDQRRVGDSGAGMVAEFLRAPSPTPATTKPAARCCWPPRWPASASATRASTCRTACRTRSPAWSTTFRRPATPLDHPLLPHGMSVILHTPAVVRFTAVRLPERHLRAAAALGANVAGATSRRRRRNPRPARHPTSCSS